MKKILFLSLTLSFGNLAFAGWFDVKSYEGNIGRYPIHISIQKLEQWHGVDRAVFGVYYYDKHKSPIYLAGKLSPDGLIVLREVETVLNESAKEDSRKYKYGVGKISLKELAGSAEGKWQGESKSLPISLKLLATLNDQDEIESDKKVSITFPVKSKHHIFIGEYKDNERRAYMERLLILNKKDGSIFQVIDLGENHGNVMTRIFDNVSAIITKRGEEILISEGDGRWGAERTLKYDRSKNQYVFAK